MVDSAELEREREKVRVARERKEGRREEGSVNIATTSHSLRATFPLCRVIIILSMAECAIYPNYSLFGKKYVVKFFQGPTCPPVLKFRLSKRRRIHFLLNGEIFAACTLFSFYSIQTLKYDIFQIFLQIRGELVRKRQDTLEFVDRSEIKLLTHPIKLFNLKPYVNLRENYTVND